MTLKKIYPIIGMSPWNSYFSEDTISITLQKVIQKFWETWILIADIPAIATYIAMWYPENRARKDKAIPKWNALKNKINRIVNILWFQDKIRIFDWKNEIEQNMLYVEYYDKIVSLYNSNSEFYEIANSTSYQVLLNTGKKMINIEDSTKIAVHYLLSELAFMEFISDFLWKVNVVYIYNKSWKIYEEIHCLKIWLSR